MKQIPGDFTPAPELLIEKYDAITALVFGRIWRYCQGKERACTASLETIANDLGFSTRTVMRKISMLIKDGYIQDEKPGARYQTHRYIDTKKAENEIKELEEAKKNAAVYVTESHTVCDLKSHEVGQRVIPYVTESHLKREVKKELKKEDKRIGGFIFGLYEQHIGGIIPPGIMQEMSGAEDDYPAEWLEAAFTIAARNNKRSWAYVRGILRRYKQQGFTEPEEKKNTDNNVWSGARASNV